MRSLIILEVEHGEDTDNLTLLLEDTATIAERYELKFIDSTVRVDLPECFRLDA